MATTTNPETAFKIYRLLVNSCLVFTSLILAFALISTFYNTKPSAVNVPIISDLIANVSGIELLQEKVYHNDHTYAFNNQILLKNLKPYLGLKDLFDQPFEVKAKNGNKPNSKYYPQFKTLMVNVSSETINRIKIPIGLFISSLVFFGVCVIYQVRKILISITVGSPFIIKNVNRIHYISLILVCIPVLIVGFRSFLEFYLSKELNIPGFKFDWDMPVIMVICYLLASLFFVIAFTIKKGIEMKVEQDLTI